MKKLKTLLLALALVACALAPARAGIMAPGPDYRPCNPQVETCPPPCDPAIETCPSAPAASAASWQEVFAQGSQTVLVQNINLLP